MGSTVVWGSSYVLRRSTPGVNGMVRFRLLDAGIDPAAIVAPAFPRSRVRWSTSARLGVSACQYGSTTGVPVVRGGYQAQLSGRRTVFWVGWESMIRSVS